MRRGNTEFVFVVKLDDTTKKEKKRNINSLANSNHPSSRDKRQETMTTTQRYFHLPSPCRLRWRIVDGIAAACSLMHAILFTKREGKGNKACHRPVSIIIVIVIIIRTASTFALVKSLCSFLRWMRVSATQIMLIAIQRTLSM